MIKKYFVLIITVFSLTGCASMIKNVTSDFADSLYGQKDIELLKDGGTAYLLLVEGLINTDFNNRDILLTGIQLFSSYNTAFITDPDRKNIFNEKTTTWSKDLLQTYKHYKTYQEIGYDNKEEKNAAFDKFLNSVKKDDVPYLFWSAFSLGMNMISNMNSPEALMIMPEIQGILGRVYELDHTFYYGAPHLFFAMLHSAYGNGDKAKAEFEKALSVSEGKLLLTKLTFAESYYKPRYMQEEYEKLLNEIIEYDVEQTPETRLMNIMTQEQAQILLENVEDAFFGNFE